MNSPIDKQEFNPVNTTANVPIPRPSMKHTATCIDLANRTWQGIPGIEILVELVNGTGDNAVPFRGKPRLVAVMGHGEQVDILPVNLKGGHGKTERPGNALHGALVAQGDVDV